MRGRVGSVEGSRKGKRDGGGGAGGHWKKSSQMTGEKTSQIEGTIWIHHMREGT